MIKIVYIPWYLICCFQICKADTGMVYVQVHLHIIFIIICSILCEYVTVFFSYTRALQYCLYTTSKQIEKKK